MGGIMRLFILLLVVIAFVVPAQAANDIETIATALSGGQVKQVVIRIRVSDQGSANGSLHARMENLEYKSLMPLIEKGNKNLQKQFSKLKQKGVEVNPLRLYGGGGLVNFQASAAVKDIFQVPTVLSAKDPVNLRVEKEDKNFSITVSPKPILWLLAPFIGKLRVEITLPVDAITQNADQISEKTLIWERGMSLPEVEFSFQLP
jgi:hypothetical protein